MTILGTSVYQFEGTSSHVPCRIFGQFLLKLFQCSRIGSCLCLLFLFCCGKYRTAFAAMLRTWHVHLAALGAGVVVGSGPLWQFGAAVGTELLIGCAHFSALRTSLHVLRHFGGKRFGTLCPSAQSGLQSCQTTSCGADGCGWSSLPCFSGGATEFGSTLFQRFPCRIDLVGLLLGKIVYGGFHDAFHGFPHCIT